jgi:SAM-dependent methyltransferase
MSSSEFAVMRREEDRHWWYRGLHDLVAVALRRHAGHLARPRLLDAGCGTGGGLQRWRRALPSAACYGMDLSADAIRSCLLRGDRRVARAAIEALPFPDASFDVVVSLDVLSMSAVDEGRAADEIRRVLRPEGTLILNLPAFEQLRGDHDRAVETRHRYTRSEVELMLRRAGLHPVRSSYWNTTLAPLLWIVRRLSPRTTAPRSDFWPTPPLVQRSLERLLRLEGAIALRRGLPFGASILCVATRDA